MFFGLGAQEVILLVILCALAALSLWAWVAKRPGARVPAAPAEAPPDRIRPTPLGRWLSMRRVVFILLAWGALGLAAKNAASEREDDRPAVFIGGALWSVLFLAIALWPQRSADSTPPDRGGEPPK
jgi:hypothetical protein